ncbi:MAG: hypothetical protein EOM87_04740, partial [Clostridia bacterium]|nr:hypothetical protein [Clostridia bacterium]
FILPDGFSLEQAEYCREYLTILKDGYVTCASVNPAISNVALAAIVTGKSPYLTGITERGVKAPAYQDIFDYALSKDKSVVYIEGNGNLIVTNIAPIYNLPDFDGYTDSNVYNSALTALEGDPDLIFVHFHGIDDVNHEYSPISEKAREKIIEIDGYIQQLVAQFEGVVIIVPDHGAVTYYNEESAPKGKHGIFEKDDMLIPYYIIDTEELD